MKRYYRPCSSTKDGPSLPSYDALARILPDGPSLPSYDALARILPDGPSLPSYDALARILPDGPSLPSYDALARILPDNTPPAGKTEGPQSNGHINRTYQKHNPRKRAPLPDFEDDLPNKEVENYRTAMRKMADDIIALRTQLVTLGTDNSQLRSDLTLHQDLGRHLLDDIDVGVMTKAEIADRIASLKFKLASESSKASAQRDKIQQLQNDLIRKNDSEKELLRLQRAHQQQQTVLQRYHRTVSKTAGLETTVKQQEKIIEKMEKLLDNTLTEKSKDNAERMVKPTVGEEDNRKETAAENSRLRGELDKIRSQPPQAAIIIQQPAQVFPDRERLSLLSKLEKAETRVRTLEKQLEDNSKRWGRQKQDMLTRLSEHVYGLDRTSSTIAHDLPPKNVSDSVLERTRQRELKPVKK
ncbi:coiled-coil domain-containing protein 33 isoform X2 [Salvelinus alpinus]|uniref:coiled-coil domain-containing protein 33 isoform X2 n=1 Tax=Salvelinus alpinus TaxID=8036 RepID=UPI0039FC4997